MDDFYISKEDCHEYLAHHGILGQKWGIRRYQNPDGSLTPEGKARYGVNYEKGVPKQMLKKAIKDYNLRTGSKLTLKDARAIRVGQFLYDKKGRRIQENTNVEESDSYKKKQALAAQKEQQAMQQQKQPKQKGVVGSWIASKAGKALNNITDTALDVGKDYLRKQLREAIGLDKPDNGPRDARNQAELLKKGRDTWTSNDWNLYNTITNAQANASTAKTMESLSKKDSTKWNQKEVEFYSKYQKAGLGSLESMADEKKAEETSKMINEYAEYVLSPEAIGTWTWGGQKNKKKK